MSTQTSGQLNEYWHNFWHNRKDWENLIFSSGVPSLSAFGDKSSTSLTLSALSLSVDISGTFSKTCCVMTFTNPTSARLSGELVIPLPDGSIVSAFGLDVNGVIVDGVAVEKEKARITFEKEVRKGVDPGLIEKVQGNTFKTRVYPIEPNGKRQVKVEITQDLGVLPSQKDAIYTFPLEIPDSVKSFDFTCSCSDPHNAPVYNEQSGLKFTFDKEKNKFLGGTTKVVKQELLSIVIPNAFEKATFVEKHSESSEHHFVISDVSVSKHDSTSGKVKKIGIVWDSSFSRESQDKSMDIKVIQSCLQNKLSGSMLVDIFELRHNTTLAFSVEIKGKSDVSKVVGYLNTVVYDGATNLGSIPTKSEQLDHDFFLLFTDGNGNIGKDIPEKQYAAPIYGFSDLVLTNHKLLSFICERSGGLYNNLRKTTVENAIATVGSSLYGIIEIEYDRQVLSDVFPNKFTPLTSNHGRFTVLGQWVGDLSIPTKVKVHFGIGGKVSKVLEYELNPKGAILSTNVAFRWAEAKIAELEIFSIQNKEEILSLGKKFSIVTTGTSLIVLETLEQHLEHKIQPHKSRTQMYNDYQTRIDVQQKSEKDFVQSKLDTIRGWYRERSEWWKKEHKKPVKRVQDPLDLDSPMSQTKKIMLGSMNVFLNQGSMLESLDPSPSHVQNFSMAPPSVEKSVEKLEKKYALSQHSEKLNDEDIEEDHEFQSSAPPSTFNSFKKSKKISKMDMMDSQKGDGPDGGPPMVKESVGGKAPSESGTGPSISVKPWDPNTPYRKALKEVTSTAEKYKVYVEQRKIFKESPAFFLDCAEHFFVLHEKDLGLRIITSVIELELSNVQLYRALAYKLEVENILDLATFCYEKILELRPEYPQPYRDLALILYKQDKYERAMQLLYKILIGKWDDRFSGMEAVAHMELNHIIAKVKKLGLNVKIPLEENLQGLLDVDLRVVFVWDSDDTCIDLWVNEPDGTKCYYGARSTSMGGFLSRDIMQGLGPNEYFIHKAHPGLYAIAANYYSNYQQSLTGATIVMSKIWRDFGRDNEVCSMGIHRIVTQGETVPLGDITIQ